MANLPESSIFEPNIYRLETVDPVLGGASGISNLQAKQLTNRTRYLYDQLAAAGLLTGDAVSFGGNVNSLTNTGLFYCTTASSNGAETSGFCWVMASGSGPRLIRQVWVGQAGIYWRIITVDISTTIGVWTLLQNDLALIGTIAQFAMATAPAGWMKANGAAISRTTYAGLFSKIGVLYGAGNGVTTFNLPDMRGYFPRAWDDSRGIDSGRAIGTAQADGFKTHHHQIAKVFASVGGTLTGYDLGTYTGAGGSGTLGADNVQDFGDTETRPKNIALLFCIKY